MLGKTPKELKKSFHQVVVMINNKMIQAPGIEF
jgi:hypothetical protein